MPRINIEDKFFIEAGHLSAKLGDFDRALGMALRWIQFGQQKFREKKDITYDEFKEEGFSDALFPRFARRKGDYVVVAGERKHYGWLEKKKEAGKKGADATNHKDESGNERQTPAEPGTSQHSPASPSPSSSLSEQKTLAVASAPAGTTPPQIALHGGIGRPWSTLHGNARLFPFLQKIPEVTREDWLNRFDANSLVTTCLNGLDFYANEGKAPNLVAWVAREERTLKPIRPAAKPNPRPAPEPPFDPAAKARALEDPAIAAARAKVLGKGGAHAS